MQMDSSSTTPVLTPDLPAYVADLAARVDRLEQRNRPQRPREHVHASVSGPHSHGMHPHQTGHRPVHRTGITPFC